MFQQTVEGFRQGVHERLMHGVNLECLLLQVCLHGIQVDSLRHGLSQRSNLEFERTELLLPGFQVLQEARIGNTSELRV